MKNPTAQDRETIVAMLGQFRAAQGRRMIRFRLWLARKILPPGWLLWSTERFIATLTEQLRKCRPPSDHSA